MHVRNISGRASDLLVRQLMTKLVSTVHAADPLHRAAKLMNDRDCGCVLVVDDDHSVIGIITDRDVALAALEEQLPLKAIPSAAAMTHHPVVIRADDTLEEAMRLMRTQQVRRLPVVDADERLIGLLTLGDIVRVTAGIRRRGEDPSASDALVETFAAVGERRPQSVAALVCCS